MLRTARLPDATIYIKVRMASIPAHPETDNTVRRWHVGMYDVNVSSIISIQSEVRIVDMGKKGSRWI